MGFLCGWLFYEASTDTAKRMSRFTSVVILADEGVTKCRLMPIVSWYSLVYSFMTLPVNCWSSPHQSHVTDQSWELWLNLN